MDKLSREKRSWNMSRIRSKNTKPEIGVRRFLFRRGFRYRVHYKVDGINVDIAFTRKKKAINVHGCFWHQHKNCIEASRPKTNSEYWKNKLKNNVARDKQKEDKLVELGWESMVVWECEFEDDPETIKQKVLDFLA